MKGLLKILCYIFYFPCLRNNKNQDHSNSHELQIITKEKKNSNTESKIINEINNEYDNNYNIINNKIYNFWYKSKSVDENIINSSYEINTETKTEIVISRAKISRFGPPAPRRPRCSLCRLCSEAISEADLHTSY